MMQSVITLTNERVQIWKYRFVGGQMNFASELSELLTDVIVGCIFGEFNVNIFMDYLENGVTRKVSLGYFLKNMSAKIFFRITSVARVFSDIFDSWNLNKQERETYHNALYFKEFIQTDLINKRRISL